MDEGLRERKKRETRQRIADMAMGLFLARGFDDVTVAEVARAADVSVNTVFNYFGTKEDLFLDRQSEAEDVPSRVVREREPGESVVTAFRHDFLEAIDQGDWRYGLNEGADAFARLVFESPALLARMREMDHAINGNLAATIAEETGAGPGDLTPQFVAGQILGATRLLARHALWRRQAGDSWQRIRPELREQAEALFDLLEKGIGDYGRRPLVQAAQHGGAAEDHEHEHVEGDHG
ncbi:TetR/AcrR family transcriptional regulator [Nonomuraea cavernae]|uniref:TetR family transcriptional regulator n=1 Tax=Nonomuraea cavernae TaxID=2045107 RepID=A0A918DM29_9ACTN|nr:TetR/AcrR family transcriptional regulator [Nonomuraea cavernae]MCA2186622.1 TetR/AcrR family transcriptional regulator [Nonomuraea cavernae]GGO71639.1 TetR family transcriptional regulator [Nonomuraea cavernae]